MVGEKPANQYVETPDFAGGRPEKLVAEIIQLQLKNKDKVGIF